jgi:toxin ParE1/3/4
MKVVWSDSALSQLSRIHDFIATDSARYALRMVDRITDRTRQLVKFPQSGQLVVEYNNPALRELIEGAYRIIYHIEPPRIVVVAVVHGARILPPTL